MRGHGVQGLCKECLRARAWHRIREIIAVANTSMLNLFPASGLDNSLFTAVLLGLLVLFVLSESFGWVFTGLVVPGYLASVFVIQPTAGAVILAEAGATYLVARAVSDWAAPVAPWFRFFGRDRFFLILLCSIAVRLVFEAALLPALGSWAAAAGLVEPTLVGNLFSVGLIVVPLTANMLWKTGLGRGTPQVLIPLAAVYLILRFVLIPYTNLSITDFELSYENVALGFLASPKTYIILLTAAYLAGRTSVTWGWDSHGMLVLALIALAWLSPLKVATTVAEVAVLVFVTRLVLFLPFLRTANLEGARRILLVFGLGFVLKFIACHYLAGNYPGIKATDYFGFGYLLPALLALKVLQKGSAAVILAPTLQTSLVALVLGTSIGLALALLQPRGVEAWLIPPPPEDGQEALELLDEAHLSTGLLLHGVPARDVRRYSFTEHTNFRKLIRELVVTRQQSSRDSRAQAASLGLMLTDWVDPDDGRTTVWLREPQGSVETLNGWGLLAVHPDATNPLVIEVPFPLAEPGSLVCGVLLFQQLDATALLVSGVDPGLGPEAFDPLVSGGLPFALARRALVGQPALEVHAGDGADSALAVVSPGLGLPGPRELQPFVGEVRPLAPRATHGAYGSPPSSARASLQLSGTSTLNLLASAYPAPPDGELEHREAGGLGGLAASAWLGETTASWGYRSPRETDLLFLDREVLTPLLTRGPEVLTDDRLLVYVDAAASLVGYDLWRVELGRGETVLLLAEQPTATRGWGSILVRPQAGSGLFLAVPRPQEETHVLDLSFHLMRLLDGSCLIIGGAPSDTAADGSANTLAQGNLGTLFAHAHRVAYRELPEPVSGLQVRGYSAWRDLAAPLVLSPGVLGSDLANQAPGLEQVVERLGSSGLGVRVYDGSRELAPLRASGNSLAELASNLNGRTYALLWSSSGLRRRVDAGQATRRSDLALRYGVQTEEVWLDEFWAGQVAANSTVTAASLGALPADLPAGLSSALACVGDYLATDDPRRLRAAIEAAGNGGLEFRLLSDLESGSVLLWLRDGRHAAAVNLMTTDPDSDAPIGDPVSTMRTGLNGLVLVQEG